MSSFLASLPYLTKNLSSWLDHDDWDHGALHRDATGTILRRQLSFQRCWHDPLKPPFPAPSSAAWDPSSHRFRLSHPCRKPRASC